MLTSQNETLSYKTKAAPLPRPRLKPLPTRNTSSLPVFPMRFPPFALPLLFVALLATLLHHFLGSLAWAGLLAVVTWPLHQRLQETGCSRAASASCLLVAIVAALGAPLLLLVSALHTELASLSVLLAKISAVGLPEPAWLARTPVVGAILLEWWHATMSQPGGLALFLKTAAGGVAPHLSSVAGAAGASFMVNVLTIFLTMLTLFVLYVQGDTVLAYADRAGAKLAAGPYAVARRLFPASVRATAIGMGSVALLEGVVLGIAYAMAGAPMPATLGVLTGYLALIPGGAPLAFTSVSLLLLGQGHTSAALSLFCWGVVELFSVDKFIRPRLIGQRMQLPFLAVLFGLLGGVSTLGIIGLFVGPFMMAVMFWWLRETSEAPEVCVKEENRRPARLEEDGAKP